MSNPDILIHVPFALKGERNVIQVERQEGQDAEDATYNLGFPPITMIPEESGGLAPKGLDFNGIFYTLSGDVVHRQSGKRMMYDASYASKIGGYSKGAILQSNTLNKEYISTVDGNITDPDSTSSSGWSVYAGAGSVPTATANISGTVKIADTLSSVATDTALSANQGRILDEKKLGKLDLVDNLNSDATWTSITARQAKILNQMKAQLDESNTFTGDNTFNGGLFFGAVTADANRGRAPLGNGLYIQWGVGNTGANGQLGALFAQPFKKQVLSYGATNEASRAPTSFCGIGQVDLNGMQIYAATSSGVSAGVGQTFRWWAIGI